MKSTKLSITFLFLFLVSLYACTGSIEPTNEADSTESEIVTLPSIDKEIIDSMKIKIDELEAEAETVFEGLE